MIRSFLFQFELVRNFLLFGFGVYSLVYILINVLKIDWTFARIIDKSALRLAAFIGLFYALFWVLNIMLNLDRYKINSFGIEESEYAFAYYWATYWLLNFCWVFAPLLLWIKAVSKFLILRSLILLFFLVSFDDAILFISSVEQDFLTSRINFNIVSTLLNSILALLIFIGCVSLFHFRVKIFKRFFKKT